MPRSVYRMFAWAIENHVPMVCSYGGASREICPIILGSNKDGEEAVLAWQTGGGSSRGRLLHPAWRCLVLTKVSDLRPGSGHWKAGSSHQQVQGCVKKVDYDANRASPYHPTRSLGDLRDVPPDEPLVD